jgi:hypothetical protein
MEPLIVSIRHRLFDNLAVNHKPGEVRRKHPAAITLAKC